MNNSPSFVNIVVNISLNLIYFMMLYLNKGLNCFCLFFDFMGFYFNRQNDKEHILYVHVLFKVLKQFPVVGIIRLLPF